MDLASELAQALADRYTLERELGRGGMASVWLARDLRHDRPVAIKVMHPELGASVAPERFVREIRVAAGLQHPNILAVFDSGAVVSPDRTGLLWYAMPFVEGESLRQRMEREGQLGLMESLRIAREVAGALSHAHGRGILHRDVKPENILLSSASTLLADFGIAQVARAAGEAALTETGTRIGTPIYMSPEQAVGVGTIDARSDVYSLGCVLYEMLAGEPPHSGPSPQAIIAKRVLDPAPAVERCRPGLPAAVRHLVRRSLEPVPADRFPDAGSFVRSLDLAERAATHGTGYGDAEPRRRVGRNARLAGGVLLGIGAAAIGTRAMTLRAGAPDSTPPARVADTVSMNDEANAAYRRATTYVGEVARFSAPPRLLEGAISLLERALELDSGFALARVRLALAHRLAASRAGDSARMNRAARLVDSVLLRFPDFPPALAAKADFQLFTAKGADSAQALYIRAATLWPGNAGILGRLAYVQALRLDSAALETGTRALALAPDDPAILRSVIISTSVFRNFDQLETWSDRLIALDPADMMGYLHKALVQVARDGDGEAAVRTLEVGERVLGRTPMNFAWVYAMAGSAGWRRWRTLSLDQVAGPDGLDSLRYYWYHAMIASAEGRPGARRAYADSVEGTFAGGAGSPTYPFRMALGAHARALRGDLQGSQRLLAEAEALRRTMVPGGLAMRQNGFAAAYAELGDVDRAVAAARWLLGEPVLYTRKAISLSPEFQLLHGQPQFMQLLADTTLP